MNRVFKVVSVIDHKTILVDFEGSSDVLPVLDDNSTADSYGNLYKFISVRLSSMNNVNDLIHYDTYEVKNTTYGYPGDKVFADADSAGLWRVYEKQDPYTQ